MTRSREIRNPWDWKKQEATRKEIVQASVIRCGFVVSIPGIFQVLQRYHPKRNIEVCRVARNGAAFAQNVGKFARNMSSERKADKRRYDWWDCCGAVACCVFRGRVTCMRGTKHVTKKGSRSGKFA